MADPQLNNEQPMDNSNTEQSTDNIHKDDVTNTDSVARCRAIKSWPDFNSAQRTMILPC